MAAPDRATETLDGAQETALLQSIGRFFLWRSKEKTRDRSVASRGKKDDNNASSRKSSATTKAEASRYKRVLNVIKKEFPSIMPELSYTVTPDVITAFLEYKPLLHRNEAQKLRIQHLENRVKHLEKNGSTSSGARGTTALATGNETSLVNEANNKGQGTLTSKTTAVGPSTAVLPAEQASTSADTTPQPSSSAKGSRTSTTGLPSSQAKVAPPLPKKYSAVSFEDRMKELEHFRKGYGHCRVPLRQKGLGRWVGELRYNYSMAQQDPRLFNPPVGKMLHPTTLTMQRIARLTAMGFEWRLAPPSVPWDERYQQLLDFKAKHGHARVPLQIKEPPGLGNWTHKQRKLYRANTINPEHKAKLEEVGFVFNCTRRTQIRWEDRLEQCREHRREHGHLKVARLPNDADAHEKTEEKSFSDWAYRMREEYRKFEEGRRSYMDRKKIRQLKELEFDFTFGMGKRKRRRTPQEIKAAEAEKKKRKSNRGRPPGWTLEGLYQSQVDKLRVVKERYGECTLKTNIDKAFPNDKSLYNWVKTQRKQYKAMKQGQNTTMTEEKLSQLQDLGFNFEPYKDYAPYGTAKAAKRAAKENLQQQQRDPAEAAAKNPNGDSEEKEDDSEDSDEQDDLEPEDSMRREESHHEQAHQGNPGPEQSLYGEGLHHGQQSYTEQQRAAAHWLAAGRARYSTGH